MSCPPPNGLASNGGRGLPICRNAWLDAARLYSLQCLLRDHARVTSQPPAWRRLSDRDRGEDRSSAPPTPPYVRVRIRRFDWLCVSTLDQGRKSKRREIGIRQGLVQSRALAHTPRAAPRACGFCRRLPAHTPPDQFRIPPVSYTHLRAHETG